MRRMPSWSQQIEARIFQQICALGIVCGGVSRYAATSLIAALSPGHRDITRFRPCHQSRSTGNHLDRAEKIPKLFRRLAPLTFLIRVQVFRDPLRGELPHVQIFMNDGPNLSTWDAQLLIYWFSRNLLVFQDYLSNLINNLRGGHCFGRPGRGASQVEMSPHLNWVTQFLTLAYDGAFSPNVSVRMAWIFFVALPCRKKKTWWHLTSRCCLNRAHHLTYFISASITRKDMQFGTWTDPPFQRHYGFLPTTSESKSG